MLQVAVLMLSTRSGPAHPASEGGGPADLMVGQINVVIGYSYSYI